MLRMKFNPRKTHSPLALHPYAFEKHICNIAFPITQNTGLIPNFYKTLVNDDFFMHLYYHVLSIIPLLFLVHSG